ncbi:glucose PTS transporter subunit EIIB, partial [Carnobacterium sp.]|uniref:glucose PTS transporter subunit EIIB n=1 Tax=Carnobacterium sp. TaxID=48221 RepID=UPI003C71845E
VHAVLTGISLFIAATFQWTAGFGFSAGLVDFILSSSLPLANKPYFLILQGLVFFAIYYFIFRFIIVKFNLATPGRGDDEDEEIVEETTDSTTKVSASSTKDAKFKRQAEIIYDGLGGDANVTSIDNCTTRLRLEVKDMSIVDEKKIKSAGIAGINKVSDHNIQVIVGTEVQFVADEMIKLKK